MAKRKKREQKEERELTRKEVRLRARDRERNRKLYLGVGSAIGLALLIILIGALYAFAYVPNATLATVGNNTIVTKEFWQRMRLERSQLINQLVNLQQLEQQFGQSFFTSQISQIEAQLQSPFALGVQVLDQMIDEEVIIQEAAERDIGVSDEEVESALQEEIARSRNAVTEPQATETAEAGTAATATATLWTPTPTPTIDANLVVTATATSVPTAEPLPTSAILSDTGYTDGLDNLQDTLRELNSVDLDGYRTVVRNRLLREKLMELVTTELVTTTETQVHARHILIRVMTPTLEIDTTSPISAALDTSGEVTTTSTITDVGALTETTEISETESVSATAAADADLATANIDPVAEGDDITMTVASSSTEDVTATVGVTTVANLTATTALTGSAAATETTTVTDSIEALTPPEPVERNDADARALAEELRQRILDGEDFATLAQQYSDDTGSGANGGDLDWFGRGAMVPPFEEAAFSQAIGEISEPIRSQFGYHIIEVLEKDENRPKDEATLEQERREAFDGWLQEQKSAMDIERPVDLNARLPRDIR